MELAVTFLDGNIVGATATTLHTAGAIGYLGGIGAFLAWRQQIRAGAHHRAVLVAAAGVTYLSILANLLGGFMRTYQSGHPSFWQALSEPWATLMVAKHGALFAGMFGAAYLFEIVAPALIKAHEAGIEAAPMRFAKPAAVAVVVSILVASVLGATATVVPISGMSDMDDMDMDEPPAQAFRTETFTFEGQSGSATPATGQFQVADGATSVEAYLYTSQIAGESPFSFTVALIDPDGRRTAASSAPGTPDPTDPTSFEYNTDVFVSASVLNAGLWSYEVSTDVGINSAWDLTVTVLGPEGLVIEDTVVLDGGFYEINTVMQEGAELHWEWFTEDGSEIHFDIHRHTAGQTEYYIDDDFAAHNGTYTAPSEGGVSLLWANGNAEPVTLTFRVWGDFTLHSIFD